MNKKIVLPGGAGLVGQNLLIHLKQQGYHDIVVLDKHHTNLQILQQTHPDITAEYADLAEPGDWQRHFANTGAVVMLQAQIGAPNVDPFIRNNITATDALLSDWQLMLTIALWVGTCMWIIWPVAV